MILMNKKAQLGKLIIAFPIILLVFVIMGIFIFLAATSTFILGGGSQKAYGEIPGDDLMLKPIIVDFNGSGAKRMLVVDALALYIDKGYGRGDKYHEEMANSLGNLISNDEMLFIFKSNSRDSIDVRNAEFYLEKSSGRLIDSTGDAGGVDSLLADKYNQAGMVRTIGLVTDKGTFYIHYYIGKRNLEASQ